MQRLTVRLLGPFEVGRDGEPVTGFPSNRVRALLAYLAMEVGHPHRREVLATLLWPDWPDRSARTNLRNALSQLRSAIGDRDTQPAFLIITRDTIQFNDASDHWLDVDAFASLVGGDLEGEQRARRLEQAVALCRGEFLEGFSLPDSAPFEDWCVLHRQRLHRDLLLALNELTIHYERRGDLPRACDFARRQLELESWLEEAHQSLMRLLALDGKRGAALAQYEVCHGALGDELGVAPSAETTRLWERIRDGELAPQSDVAAGVRAAPSSPESSESERGESPAIVRTSPVAERRIATVLSAEVVRSRELLAAVGTEAWAERMNRVLGLLASELRRYGGEVAQFRQHRLLAFFGLSTAHEDDGERAVLAALAMQEVMDTHHADQSSQQVPALRLAVGVNTGEVITSTAGGEGGRPDRTALGPAVVVAEGLRTAAGPGAILVGATTHRLVELLFEWAAPCQVAVSDGLGTVTAHRPVAHMAPADKGRDVAGIQSPLVGREAELAALREAVASLRDGLGSIVTLVGEAGIGESRLVAEVRRAGSTADTGAPRWVEGRCLSYGAGFAYLLWQSLLRDLLGVEPSAATEVTSAALLSTVRRLCAGRFDVVYPYLARLLSLPLEPEYAVVRNLQGANLRAEITQAVQLLIQGAARERPLVIVCEDLHWADPTSIDLLEKILPLADREPLLVLLVFRPERDHGCRQLMEHVAREYGHRHTDLQLRALSAAEGEIFVGNLLRAGSLPAELQTRLFDHSGGNPFFVEELVRSLMEAGAVVLNEDTTSWRATVPLDQLDVPDSLQSVLVARIDRLPSDAKRVLQMASTIGRTFSMDVLSGMADGQPLDTHLVALLRGQLIRERSRIPEATYIFKHDLTREAAYGGLLSPERRAYHRKAAETIERLYARRLDEHVGELARHRDLVEEPEKAIPYLLRAGSHAYAAYANREAAAYYGRVLVLLEEPDVADHPSHASWHFEVLRRLGRLSLHEAQLDTAEDLLRAAIALGRRIGITPRTLAPLFSRLGDVLCRKAQFDELIHLGEEGLSLLGPETVSAEAAMLSHIASIGNYGSGQVEQGHDLRTRTARIIRHLPHTAYSEELAGSFAAVAATYCELGDHSQALACVSALEDWATEHHDLRSLALALELEGEVRAHTGDLWQARDLLERALVLHQRVSPISAVSSLCELGWVDLCLGQLGSAVRYARACADTAKGADRLAQFHASAMLGLIHLCRGAFGDAARVFERQLKPDVRLNSRNDDAWSHYALGLVRLAQGDAEAAVRSLLASVELMPRSLLCSQKMWGLPALGQYLAALLDSLEAAWDGAHAFRAQCRRLREIWAASSEAVDCRVSALAQWFLEPANPRSVTCTLLQDSFQTGLAPGWRWHDPFGDCSFVAATGLEIRAANGRWLQGVNRSAPRLLRSVRGDLAVQTVCSPVITAGRNVRQPSAACSCRRTSTIGLPFTAGSAAGASFVSRAAWLVSTSSSAVAWCRTSTQTESYCASNASAIACVRSVAPTQPSGSPLARPRFRSMIPSRLASSPLGTSTAPSTPANTAMGPPSASSRSTCGPASPPRPHHCPREMSARAEGRTWATRSAVRTGPPRCTTAPLAPAGSRGPPRASIRTGTSPRSPARRTPASGSQSVPARRYPHT